MALMLLLSRSRFLYLLVRWLLIVIGFLAYFKNDKIEMRIVAMMVRIGLGQGGALLLIGIFRQARFLSRFRLLLRFLLGKGGVLLALLLVDLSALV